jgi:bacillithiol system protein YtxJ
LRLPGYGKEHARCFPGDRISERAKVAAVTRIGSLLHRQTTDDEIVSSTGDGFAEAAFVRVPDETELDRLFEQSHENPVVLYLHDPYCPISARAYGRVAGAGGKVHLIDVSHQYALNRAVEHRTGVRHESPQAFVLRDGKPVWHASHSRISTESLAYARDSELGD